MAILEELRGYLVANGVSPVFMVKMPDTPDDAVCLYEYAGIPPEFAHDGQQWENLRVQAVARDASYTSARDKAQSVYDVLNGTVNTTIDSSRYLKILALQSPFPMGADENDRPRIVVNFEIGRV
jgi:transglutaminase-like putative cysteine protease